MIMIIPFFLGEEIKAHTDEKTLREDGKLMLKVRHSKMTTKYLLNAHTHTCMKTCIGESISWKETSLIEAGEKERGRERERLNTLWWKGAGKCKTERRGTKRVRRCEMRKVHYRKSSHA